MAEQSAEDYLKLAEEHLARVHAAWDAPTDWAIVTSFSLYCVEAAVMAAVKHSGLPSTRSHMEKARFAQQLQQKHGLPDVSLLMRNLNAARKAAAYGDVEAPQLDAEDLTVEIEAYVDAVRELVRA